MALQRSLPAGLDPVARFAVAADWLDYNGHMTEYAYTLVFARASAVMLTNLGLGGAYKTRTGRTLYTLENHVAFLREAKLGEMLAVRAVVLDTDAKRLQLYGELFDSDERLLAAYECMLMHVAPGDTAPVPAPFDDDTRLRLEAARAAAAPYGWPAMAGARIGIRRKPA